MFFGSIMYFSCDKLFGKLQWAIESTSNIVKMLGEWDITVRLFFWLPGLQHGSVFEENNFVFLP